MRAAVLSLVMSVLIGSPAVAGTFVYVSNAEDGDIGLYTMGPDGALTPGQRFKAEKLVMPMAVTPDKRFLIAAVRSKPYQAFTYGIDRGSGALTPVATGPLAESYPYITVDRNARFLLGASYGGHQVGVNPIGPDGRVGEPVQVVPTARNAHSIRLDNTNQFVFVRTWHGPGLPVRVRRAERAIDGEHASGAATETGNRAAPSHRLEG